MTRLTEVVSQLPEPAPPKPRRPRRPKAESIVEIKAVPAGELARVARIPFVEDAAPGQIAPMPRNRPADGSETPSMRQRRRQVERRQVFEDLWTQLGQEQPPPTKKGLAKILSEYAKAPVRIMRRDALVRLAAWAVAAAIDEDAQHRHEEDLECLSVSSSLPPSS